MKMITLLLLMVVGTILIMNLARGYVGDLLEVVTLLDSEPSIWGIAVNNTHVMVNNGGNKVYVYYQNMTYITNWTTADVSSRDMAMNGSNIWIMHYTSPNNNVDRYTTNGTFVDTWQLTAPNADGVGICVSNKNKSIFINDLVDNKVYRYTLTGVAEDNFNTSPSGNTQPRGLACSDVDNSLYVNDIGGKIYKYAMNGTFNKSFSLKGGETQPAGLDISPNGSILWNVDGNADALTNTFVKYEASSSDAPNVSLSKPANYNVTSNTSIVFNFTIMSPKSNVFNYTLYVDTSPNPTTSINQTQNITNSTLIFNYTLAIGVYYWKVNGTDNESNLFTSTIYSFNITTELSVLYANWLSTTIIDGTQVIISINATQGSGGNLKNINISVLNPNGLWINRSCIDIGAISYICNVTFFDGDETSVVGIWNLTIASATDTSNNLIIVYPNTTLTVNTVAGGGGTTTLGGGGGSPTVIVKGINGTPLLSFGITEVSFFVITTPSQQQKIIKFINLGNGSFEGGKIEIQGDIKPYVNAQVCDLDIANCKPSDITLKAGQNAFLVINGTFIPEIGNGKAGIVRLNGNRVFDLAVVIDRPPLYSKVIVPLMGTGLSEGWSYVVGYPLLASGVILVVLTLKQLVGA